MANYNVYPDVSKRSPHGAQNNLRELLHALEAEAAMEAVEDGEVGGMEGKKQKMLFLNKNINCRTFLKWFLKA